MPKDFDAEHNTHYFRFHDDAGTYYIDPYIQCHQHAGGPVIIDSERYVVTKLGPNIYQYDTIEHAIANEHANCDANFAPGTDIYADDGTTDSERDSNKYKLRHPDAECDGKYDGRIDAERNTEFDPDSTYCNRYGDGGTIFSHLCTYVYAYSKSYWYTYYCHANKHPERDPGTDIYANDGAADGKRDAKLSTERDYWVAFTNRYIQHNVICDYYRHIYAAAYEHAYAKHHTDAHKPRNRD